MREALANAAVHCGADAISVFVGVESALTTSTCPTTDGGFDIAAAPDERRSILDAIEVRMWRAGSCAVIRTAPGEGTEIIIGTVPRSRR